MMQIILISIEVNDMAHESASATHGTEHLTLLTGSIAHVYAYLTTGSQRAALRAQLLLDRLEALDTPASQPTQPQLRRALPRGQGARREDAR